MNREADASIPTEFTVYVVDDEESIRSAFELYLTSRGIAVCSFASGEEFLGRCQPDWRGCVFLDIRMASLSGQEVFRHMRGRSLDLTVVFMTGHEDAGSLKSEFGATTQVLEKPFSGNDLDEVLRSLPGMTR